MVCCLTARAAKGQKLQPITTSLIHLTVCAIISVDVNAIDAGKANGFICTGGDKVLLCYAFNKIMIAIYSNCLPLL